MNPLGRAPTRKTREQIIREFMRGRRKPLHGIEAAALARQIGLPWELTGTGLKPGTALKSRAGIQFGRRWTCRKCEIQAKAGKPRCGYCHNDFTEKAVTDHSQAVEAPIRHLVMENGSMEKVEVDESGHVFKPPAGLTKKERNRLKREQRKKTA